MHLWNPTLTIERRDVRMGHPSFSLEIIHDNYSGGKASCTPEEPATEQNRETSPPSAGAGAWSRLLPSSPCRAARHRAGRRYAPPAIDSGAPQPTVIAEIHAQAARPAPGESVVQIPLDQIDPNPYQTREEFDEEVLEELRESIRANGVVQPIVVRPARGWAVSAGAGRAALPGVEDGGKDDHSGDCAPGFRPAGGGDDRR